MAQEPVADILEIFDTIPHRYPFLLVDRITNIEDNRIIEGFKNVSINEPFFQGHFPGEPIMPGVLIVESMAQVGAMLLKRVVPDHKSKLIVFLGLDKVRFRQVVRPGDRLEFRVELTRPSLKAARLEGVARVDGNEVARATLLASIVERQNREGNL